MESEDFGMSVGGVDAELIYMKRS